MCHFFPLFSLLNAVSRLRLYSWLQICQHRTTCDIKTKTNESIPYGTESFWKLPCSSKIYAVCSTVRVKMKWNSHYLRLYSKVLQHWTFAYLKIPADVTEKRNRHFKRIFTRFFVKVYRLNVNINIFQELPTIITLLMRTSWIWNMRSGYLIEREKTIELHFEWSFITKSSNQSFMLIIAYTKRYTKILLVFASHWLKMVPGKWNYCTFANYSRNGLRK